MFALAAGHTLLADEIPADLVIPAWVLAVVLLVNLLVQIWDRTRRKPPADMTFASKLDLEKLDSRTRMEIDAVNERSEMRARENRDLIQSRIADMEKWIGEKIADNKSSNSEQFGQLRGELHALRGTMQSLSNDLFRSVGRMEGPQH